MNPDLNREQQETGKMEEGMKHRKWHMEYVDLDDLFHRLENRNRHASAEKVADRLSEMELTEPDWGE